MCVCVFSGQCGDRGAGAVCVTQRHQAAEDGEEQLLFLRLLQSAEALQVRRWNDRPWSRAVWLPTDIPALHITSCAATRTSCLCRFRRRTCWSSTWPTRSWSCSPPKPRRSNTWSTTSSRSSRRCVWWWRPVLICTYAAFSELESIFVDVTMWCVCVCQDSEYVVAVRNYITEDRSLLSFHKGDIIRLQHMDGLGTGETRKDTME